MKKILISLLSIWILQAQEISIQQCVVDCKECVINGDSSSQIELAKSQNEEAFYDMADHAMWAFSQMSDYLELNKIPIKYIELDKCPNLTFQNQKVNTIPKNNGVFNYIFFKQGKAPYILQDHTMPEDEINKYFELKNPKEPAPAIPTLVSDCSVIYQECGLLNRRKSEHKLYTQGIYTKRSEK